MNVFNTFCIEDGDDVRAWRSALTGFVRAFLDVIVCRISAVRIALGISWDVECFV